MSTWTKPYFKEFAAQFADAIKDAVTSGLSARRFLSGIKERGRAVGFRDRH